MFVSFSRNGNQMNKEEKKDDAWSKFSDEKKKAIVEDFTKNVAQPFHNAGWLCITQDDKAFIPEDKDIKKCKALMKKGKFGLCNCYNSFDDCPIIKNENATLKEREKIMEATKSK